MHKLHVYPIILLLTVGSALADQQTTVPGQQMIVARRTSRPVTIDGVLEAAEWAAAIPVHVDAVKPTMAPGVVPNNVVPGLTPPDNQDDLSFTIQTMYDDDNLYVAVTVADDVLKSPYDTDIWRNDDVEILIDGDRQPWDLAAELFLGYPCGDPYVNLEGYQLITAVNGARQTVPGCNTVVAGAWTSAVHLAPRGYVVEVKIPLDIINTHNNSPWDSDFNPVPQPPIEYQRPQPGDVIGFNVFVGDNDSGLGYADSPTAAGDSFLAWDGNGGVDESGNSLWGGPIVEQDWGNLYFAP